MKTALITGITGQDGSFLAEFLLEKGYEVHGTIRRSSVDYRERIAHLEGRPHFHLHYADLGDSMSLIQVVGKVRPDEIYNLAAQSHVQVSFDAPEFTADVDATGVLRILEAVRQCGLAETCRIYQASTSELYGKVEQVPQNEQTPFHPYSPYAVAKLYGFWIVKEYREAYNLFCCSIDFANQFNPYSCFFVNISLYIIVFIQKPIFGFIFRYSIFHCSISISSCHAIKVINRFLSISLVLKEYIKIFHFLLIKNIFEATATYKSFMPFHKFIKPI